MQRSIAIWGSVNMMLSSHWDWLDVVWQYNHDLLYNATYFHSIFGSGSDYCILSHYLVYKIQHMLNNAPKRDLVGGVGSDSVEMLYKNRVLLYMCWILF